MSLQLRDGRIQLEVKIEQNVAAVKLVLLLIVFLAIGVCSDESANNALIKPPECGSRRG